MVPDISQEELVWDITPAYGGSIYGIKPFTTAGASMPLQDTSDVTDNADQAVVHEMPPPIETRQNKSTSDVNDQQQPDTKTKSSSLSWLTIFTLMCIAVVVGIVISQMRKRRHTYEPLA